MLGESGAVTIEHILMTHVYDGLKEDTIVYNSPLLKKCALEVKSKKRKGYLENEDYFKEENKMKEVKLNIEGMHCTGCSTRLEKVLNNVDGVEIAKVSLEEKKADIK